MDDESAGDRGAGGPKPLVVVDLAAAFHRAVLEQVEFAGSVEAMNVFGHVVEAMRQLVTCLCARPRYRKIVAVHRLRLVLSHLVFRSGGAYVAIAGVVAAIAGAYYAGEQTRISAEQTRLIETQIRAAEAQARAADAAYEHSVEAAYIAERARLRGLLFDREPWCAPAARYCRHGMCGVYGEQCPLRVPVRLRSDATIEFVRLERRWRSRHSEVEMMPIDLREVELANGSLQDAELFGVDLRSADLRGADLSGADLTGAWLQWADLRGAGLRDADFSCASLVDADLTGADTLWSIFFGADLASAHGGEAFFGGFGPYRALYDEATELGDEDPEDYDMEPGGHPGLHNAYEVDLQPGGWDPHPWCVPSRFTCW